MRLRRCASLMFEPREAVTLDLRAMLAGHAEMDSQISWVALAAHLDQPLPVDAEERSCWASSARTAGANRRPMRPRPCWPAWSNRACC